MRHDRLNEDAGFGVAGVIVIVLAVLVAGLIAWRVYDTNNPAQTSESKSTPGQAEDAPLATAPVVESNDGYVVIEQWDVRFKPSAELGEVQYFKPKNLESYDAVTFTTKALADASVSCSPSSENIILGLLYRSAEQRPGYGETLAKIGDYYYQYRGPQAICGDGNGKTESDVLVHLIAALKTLEAAK